MKSTTLRQWEAAAYAAGRLTQIRRVVKPQPFLAPYRGGMPMLQLQHKKFMMIRGQAVSHYVTNSADDMTEVLRGFPCPYGAPGDRLALREGARMPLSGVRWHPVITAVRLERVQDITEADAIRCGVETLYTQQEIDNKPGLRGETIPECGYKNYLWHGCATGSISKNWYHQYSNYLDAKGSFSSLWQRDNPRTPWESDPWVWVIEVERVKG